MAVVLGVALGCSEPARDRVMRFFFEVPEAGAEAVALDPVTPTTLSDPSDAGGVPMALGLADRWILHSPYELQECASCHASDTGMAYGGLIDGACRKCHAAFFDSNRRPHMPDLNTRCRACHHPHRSQEPALLRLPQPDICWDCHPATLAQDATHAPAVEQSCTSCHEAHHSNHPHLLRRDSQPGELMVSPQPPSEVDPVEAGARPGADPDDFEDLRDAFYTEVAAAQGIGVADARAADGSLSDDELPFDPDDPAMIDAGAVLFTLNCVRCHGANLDGRGYIEYRRKKKVDLLRESRRRGWDTDLEGKAADTYATITDGWRVIGEPSMPPFEEKLAKQQRWQLVAYVRAKQIEADR